MKRFFLAAVVAILLPVSALAAARPTGDLASEIRALRDVALADTAAVVDTTLAAADSFVVRLAGTSPTGASTPIGTSFSCGGNTDATGRIWFRGSPSTVAGSVEFTVYAASTESWPCQVDSIRIISGASPWIGGARIFGSKGLAGR